MACLGCNDMSRQWGHGFHRGHEEGQRWGELIASGEWEARLVDVNERLILLANALRLPVEFQSGRTEIWWQMYVGAAAKQLENIARELPGTVTEVHEFTAQERLDSALPQGVQA